MQSDNSLQGLAELHSEIAELAQALPTERPDARYQGRDSNHIVTLEIDASTIVHKITIDRGWHSADGDLAGAIIEAIQHAEANRYSALARAAEIQPRNNKFPDSAALAYASGAEMANTLHEVAGNLDRDTGERMLNDLLTMLEEIDASLDSTQQRIAEHIDKTHTGRTRHVTVTVTSTNEVMSIKYDRRWLDTAHEFNIARETQEALQQAYQKAREVSTKDIIATTPLGEFERLTKDPVALARRFGLRDGG